MTPRGLVHQHVLGDAIEARRRDVREVAAEGFFDVEQRDSSGVRDRFVEIGGVAKRCENAAVARSALNDS